MKKILICLAVTASLMACNGKSGQDNGNAANEQAVTEQAEAQAEASIRVFDTSRRKIWAHEKRNRKNRCQISNSSGFSGIFDK